MKHIIALILVLAIAGSAALYLLGVWIGSSPREAGTVSAIYFLTVVCAAYLLIRKVQRIEAQRAHGIIGE